MRSFTIIIICLLHFAVGRQIECQESPNFTKSLFCGPNSLLFVCKEFGVETDFEALCKATGYKKGKGTTMLGIYSAALALGLDAVPVKTDVEKLCEMNKVSIVFVLDKHFTVVTNCTQDSVTYIDYPGEFKSMQKDRFRSAWSGEALVFKMSEKSKKKLTTKVKEKHGPSVAFESHIRDFGIIEPNTTMKHVFKFANVGTEPLQIQVRSTCSCTAALLSQEVTQPGETGEIKLEYNPGEKKGLSNVKVICRTNDPENKFINLSLVSEVSQDVIPVPAELYAGKVIGGEKIIKTVKLFKSTASDFMITGIECPDGVSARILAKEESQHYNHVIPVEFTIITPTLPGRFNGLIKIKTSNDKIIDVPFSGISNTPIQLFPQKLVFCNVPAGSTMEKTISLKNQDGKPIRVDKVIVSDNRLRVESVASETSENIMSVSVHADSELPYFEGNCKIYVSGSHNETLSLPVIARFCRK